MPRYYCDYCDVFLTHDSPSVRKQHNRYFGDVLVSFFLVAAPAAAVHVFVSFIAMLFVVVFVDAFLLIVMSMMMPFCCCVCPGERELEKET